MNIEKANRTLLYNVYAPAFFEKLAQHGYVPRTHQEAVQYFNIGLHFSEIRNVGAGMVKSAAAAVPDHVRYQAAALAGNPHIRKAVTTFRDAWLAGSEMEQKRNLGMIKEDAHG